MFNFKSTNEESAIRESLDRKNRKPQGSLSINEDEELVNKNDPRKKFIDVGDVADDYDFTDHISLDSKDQEEYEDVESQAEFKNDITVEPVNVVEDKLLEDMLPEKENESVEVSKSEKMDLKSYKDFGLGSKKDIRENTKHGRGHYGDNRKTISENKKARDQRGEIREFLGK